MNRPRQGSLESRARRAILLGYASNKKAYKLWDTCKEEIVISQDVVFEENTTLIRAFGDDTSFCEDGIEVGDGPSDTYTPQGNEASANIDWGQEVPEFNSTGDETHSTVNAAPNTESERNKISEPRRSQRERKAPQEWWKATALSAIVPENELSFSAATKGEGSQSWTAAIQTEIDAIEENKTWSLVPRTEAKNILTSSGYSKGNKS